MEMRYGVMGSFVQDCVINVVDGVAARSYGVICSGFKLRRNDSMMELRSGEMGSFVIEPETSTSVLELWSHL